ncbi:MAG: 3-deoxy-7-phosphoheptulonate synthase [Bacillota bacterium]
MIVVMERKSGEKELNKIENIIKEAGYSTHISKGVEKTIIGVVGGNGKKEILKNKLLTYKSIEKVIPILEPYKLTSWNFHPEKTIINLDGVKIGGEEPTIMAGPCAVESEEQLLNTAHIVKKAGAKILRGGAFKPRTSPYTFQGLGEEGLKLLAKARTETGLKIITELMDLDHLDLVNKYTDIIQIGARNMQNYPLLTAVGRTNTPVMLKRGMSATIKEWLLAAEYIMTEGNQQVILCERGIRTFSQETRNTLDLSSVPLVQSISHLPVIVDPSHGTGKWELVIPMARAGIAVGADGLIIEVHPEPGNALSDGQQSLKPDKFQRLMTEIAQISRVIKSNQN